MDIYVHILRKMGFKVSDISGFYVCNGEKVLIILRENWIYHNISSICYRHFLGRSNIKEIKKTLELNSVPEINKSCEQCMYLDAGVISLNYESNFLSI